VNTFSVDICIITYKRPQQLGILLDSLASQDTGSPMHIIVIDNDSQASAQATVTTKRQQHQIDISYAVEPVQGISHARNHALQKITAPFAAFLDDDEYVGVDWLRNMRDTIIGTGADVVSGPVNRVLPDSTPQWVRQLPMYRQVDKKTGTRIECAGFGNVLIRTAALGNPRLQVDPQFAQTGGEDTDFFYRLHNGGKMLVWCNEAVAYEPVTAERITLAWILKRNFRSGQTFSRVFIAGMPMPQQCAWAIQQSLLLAGGMVALPFWLLLSFKKAMALACKISSTLGKLSGLFGKRFLYGEYKDRTLS
jgi:succinoglycan biosynthesis protein ExoM